jgi:hypothetical protein
MKAPMGPWHEALGQLAAILMGTPGVRAAEGGLLTVASLRVSGDAGELLVTTRTTEDGQVEFLAPGLGAVRFESALEVLGTSEQLPLVAGVVRRRLAAQAG